MRHLSSAVFTRCGTRLLLCSALALTALLPLTTPGAQAADKAKATAPTPGQTGNGQTGSGQGAGPETAAGMGTTTPPVSPTAPGVTLTPDPATLRTGYVLMDAKTGQVLAAEKARETFIPASVTKVVSMIGILSMAPPDFRFSTTVTATGPVKNGIVQGDLILVGGGDASLDIDAFEELVQTLKDQGIKGIKGKFLYDATALPTIPVLEATQPPEVPYNPGLSGLGVSYNRFRIGFDKQGKPVGLEQPLALYPEPLPATLDKNDTALAVHDAALYAARTFVWVADRNGLKLPAPQAAAGVTGSVTLARHLSEPLTEMLKASVYHSNNVALETMSLAVTAGKTLQEAADSLRKLAQTAIPSVAWGGLVMPNASGLSPEGRMTPGQCAALARFAGTSSVANQPLKPFLPGLMQDPFGIPDGYLNSPSTLRGKSGTMFYARALAGVFTAKSGREMAYCVMSDDQVARIKYDAIPFDQREADTNKLPARDWLKSARAKEAALITGWIEAN